MCAQCSFKYVLLDFLEMQDFEECELGTLVAQLETISSVFMTDGFYRWQWVLAIVDYAS